MTAARRCATPLNVLPERKPQRAGPHGSWLGTSGLAASIVSASSLRNAARPLA